MVTYTIPLLFFLLAPVCYAVDSTPSLCQKKESALFNCQLKSKTLSLCGSGDLANKNGNIQYRFGTLKKIELQSPETPMPSGINFWRSSTGYSGGGEYRIRFRSGDYDYIMFENTIRTNFDGTNNPEFNAGLIIRKNGKTLSSQKCSYSYTQFSEVPLSVLPQEEFDFDVTP